MLLFDFLTINSIPGKFAGGKKVHGLHMAPVYKDSTLKMFPSAFSPVCPEEMDWSELYPHFFAGDAAEQNSSRVEFADIGCGYGGLLGTSLISPHSPHSPAPMLTPPSFISPVCLFCLSSVELSPLFPDKLMLGLEIRVKVSDYVRDRIQSLRASEPSSYQNIACLRSNAMKYLPNFFSKGQVNICICCVSLSCTFNQWYGRFGL